MNARPSLALLLLACGETGPAEPAPKSLEEQAAEKCPRVHLDKLAGDWVLGTGDVKTRMRVVDQGGETLLWYTDPAFSNHRLELVGTKRDKDWQFEERPSGKRAKLIEAGGEEKKRVYVAPKLQRCRLEVYAGTVDAAGKETMPPKGKDFAMFPDAPGVTFSFAPFAEPLFVGEAAKGKAAADQQLAEQGEPKPDVDRGSILAAAYSVEGADGDPSCTFTATAFFDGQAVEGAAEVPAAPPADGVRVWSYTFEAPYTGNHALELHRYRTCGGKKELIAVAGLDAILL